MRNASYPILKIGFYNTHVKIPKGLSAKIQTLAQRVVAEKIPVNVVLCDAVADSYDRHPVRKTRWGNILPPIGALALSDMIEVFGDNPQALANRLPGKTKPAAGVFRRLLGKMTESDFWNEMYLYQFFQINEFLCSGKASDGETFETFRKTNEDYLDKVFDTFDFTYNEKVTEPLADAYSGGYTNTTAAVLGYRRKGRTKIQPILDGFTQGDFRKIIKRAEELPVVNDGNAVRILSEVEKEIHTPLMTKEEVRDEALRAFLASTDAFTTGNLSLIETTYFFTKYVMDAVDASLLLRQQEIVKFLKEHSREITPIEMMTVFFVVGNPSSAFRACDREKATIIISEALKKTTDPVAFLTFLTEVVFDYSGTLASYGEWMKSISGGGEDYSLGLTLVMGLMTSEKKAYLQRDRVPDQEDFTKHFAHWAD